MRRMYEPKRIRLVEPRPLPVESEPLDRGERVALESLGWIEDDGQWTRTALGGIRTVVDGDTDEGRVTLRAMAKRRHAAAAAGFEAYAKAREAQGWKVQLVATRVTPDDPSR